MTQDPVAVIGGLFASEGLADYLGEPVTQAAHISVYTLGVQGGPMSAAETAGFEALRATKRAGAPVDDHAEDPDAPRRHSRSTNRCCGTWLANASPGRRRPRGPGTGIAREVRVVRRDRPLAARHDLLLPVGGQLGPAGR